MISFAKPICGEARSRRNPAAEREGKVAQRFAGWGLKWLLNHGDAAMLSGLWFTPSFQCAFSHVPASPGSPPLPAPDMLGACMVCGCVPAPSQHFLFAWCPRLQGFCCTRGALGCCSNPSTSSARCHRSPGCEGVTAAVSQCVTYERARAQEQAHLISFLSEP